MSDKVLFTIPEGDVYHVQSTPNRLVSFGKSSIPGFQYYLEYKNEDRFLDKDGNVIKVIPCGFKTYVNELPSDLEFG